MEEILTYQKNYTFDDLNSLPDGNYEIINGKRVDMSPTGFIHGKLEYKLARFLEDYLEDQGYVAVGEIGIVISKVPFRLRAADVVYISKKTSPQEPEGILQIAPDLIIEILSKSDTVEKMNNKIKDYLLIGVERIVVVDPATESVSIYHQKSKGIDLYHFDEEFELYQGIKIIMNQIL